MKTLSSYQEDYYTHTGNASTVSRQVAFAGIALIWIFKSSDSGGGLALPVALLWPSLFFVVGLGLDLLQYVVASAIWGVFARSKEKKGVKPDAGLTAPRYFNWPALVFFWGKVSAIIAGYVFLLAYVKSTIQFQ